MNLIAGLKNLNHAFEDHPLTRNYPLGAWFRFAKWQLQSRVQSEVLVDWIGGQTLALRRGMAGATPSIYLGLHEFLDMTIALHFLRPEDLFLDIGANVGVYTVLASGVCRAQTLAFEPDPDTLRGLVRNVEVNRLNDRVQIHDCALGPSRGEVAFTVGLDAANRIAPADAGPTRTVRMEKLDEIVAGLQPIMMKIDVEGEEHGVLSGAERVLASPRLKVAEVESTLQEPVLAIFARHGFERVSYDPFQRKLSSKLGEKWCNMLFVRDRPFVEARLKTAQPIEIFGRKI